MTIDYDKRVYVYWNLHRKIWSVRQSGIVVDHAKTLSLYDCRFLVGEAGRQRVLAEKKKNVHAGVSGYLFEDPLHVSKLIHQKEFDDIESVMYNPYKYRTFVTGYCAVPVYGAAYVDMGIEVNPYVQAVNPCYVRT